MSSGYYPEARQIQGRYAGTMDGTNDTRKVIFHNEGVDRDQADDLWLAQYVHARNIGYHFVYSWWSDTITQLYPIGVAARSCGNPGNLPASPNKQGRLAVQVCAAGFGRRLLSDRQVKPGWQRFARWLEAQGIPNETSVNWANPKRSWGDWTRSGWTSHAHAPGNDHTDGTGENITKLWTPTSGSVDDMPNYGEAARGTLTIPPGGAVWIPWQERSGQMGDLLKAGSSVIRAGGQVVSITADLTVTSQSEGALVVRFCENEAGAVKSVGAHTVNVEGGKSRHLVSDTLRVGARRRLRVMAKNETGAPVTLDRSRLRMIWWGE